MIDTILQENKTAQIYTVEGMTCQGCKASVEKHLSEIEGVRSVSVDLDNAEATITSNRKIDLSALKAALPSKYAISNKDIFKQKSTTVQPKEEKGKLEQLKPLFLVFGYITLAAILMNIYDWETREVMLDFMGIFFFVFSFFKLLDIKGFSQSFAMYDPLAREFPVYGKIYPFIEVALGIMFFIRFEMEIALAITICVLMMTTVGVTRTLLKKRQIQCACLGSVLKLPMTLATFIENAIMIAMAGSMILGWV